MRSVVYLSILLVVLIGGTLMLRGYNKSLPLPSIISSKLETKKKPSVEKEYLAGTIAQKTGDTDKAIQHFESALEQKPDNIDIIQRLYGLYIFKGDYEAAIDLAERQYEIDKKEKTPAKKQNAIAYLLLALDDFKKEKTRDIYPLLEPLVDPRIEDKTHIDAVVIPLVLAWSYVVNEDYKNAFRVIDSITEEYMRSIFSFNRALINDIAHNKKVLIEGKDYSRHEKAEKLLSEVFFEIGQFSLQSANVEESIIYLRLARFLDPESFKFSKMLAYAYESMGKQKEAIAIYNEVPESSENYGSVLLALALDYHQLDDNKKSLEVLEKLKGVKGYEYQALLGIGTIAVAEKDYAEAVKYFKQAEALIEKPTAENWNVYFNLGVAYDKMGDWENAEKNLRRSVELMPENYESLNYLAYSWLVRNQNIKQARAMLESAVIRSGGAPYILDSYGWALFKMGAYNEAIPFLEQATNGMAYSVVISDHLGDAYWKAGRKREAKFQWRKALDVFDKDQDLTPEVTKEQLKKKIESGIE